MIVRTHYLYNDDGTQIEFQKSPNQSTGIYPLYLVIHYTADITLDGAVSWFLNSNANASSHLVIDRDGTIKQMVAFNRRAWHAGVSTWGHLEGLNRYSIGIELVNAGKLTKNTAGRWVNWAGHIIPDGEVTIAKHRDESEPTGWHQYTDLQIQTVLNAALALQATYKFIDVLGHDDISPGRKVDPGPLFPMISFRSKVLGRA
jgi:N-acetylmuramoyl-L-alanine amidase